MFKWTHIHTLSVLKMLFLCCLKYICTCTICCLFLLFSFTFFSPPRCCPSPYQNRSTFLSGYPLGKKYWPIPFNSHFFVKIHIKNNKGQNIQLELKKKITDVYVWYQELLSRETHKTGVVNLIRLLYSSLPFSHTWCQKTTLQFRLPLQNSSHNTNSFTNTTVCHYVSSKILKIMFFYHVIQMPSAICAKHHSLSELFWKPS